MKNSKGLSTVVTSLILILLVLVAIGLIWLVVRNVVEGGSESISISDKCLAIDVRASDVDCSTPSACEIVLTRKAGGDDIDGVKLVFKNSTGDSSAVIDVPENIEELTTKTVTEDSEIASANKVEVTVYLKDDSGEEQYCSQTNSFSF